MRNVTRITQTTLTMIRFLLPFLLVTPLLFLSTVSAFAQEGDSVLSQLDGAAQTVAMAINQARANAGLPPFALHPLLNAAAQNHVNDMVANYHYSHSGSDGSNVRQRVQRTGYANTWASENWVSVNEPSMAIQWWMNSTVHRGNILNQNWHEFGVGVGHHPDNGQVIFVAVFAAGESGDAAQFVMPPAPEPLPIPTGGADYTIQPGDTLLSIGLRYGVEWPVIATANNLSEFSLLQIGQVIRLPGIDDIDSSGGTGGPVDNTVNAASTESDEETATGDVFVRRYTVQPGDTLVVIASIYGLSWEEIAAENGLGEYSVISVGKELRIPGAVKRAETSATEETQTEATPAEVSLEKAPEAQVAPGETKEETVVRSAATGKSASEEVVAEETVTEKVAPPEYYTVKSGDTVISIALKHDLDWHDLLQINNLTENSILQLGQELRIR